eukprot:SAG25_NODE_2524_length_1554_cov_1.206186_1_plen_48_part_01
MHEGVCSNLLCYNPGYTNISLAWPRCCARTSQRLPSLPLLLLLAETVH